MGVPPPFWGLLHKVWVPAPRRNESATLQNGKTAEAAWRYSRIHAGFHSSAWGFIPTRGTVPHTIGRRTPFLWVGQFGVHGLPCKKQSKVIMRLRLTQK
jgi:hypothetical protein